MSSTKSDPLLRQRRFKIGWISCRLRLKETIKTGLHKKQTQRSRNNGNVYHPNNTVSDLANQHRAIMNVIVFILSQLVATEYNSFVHLTVVYHLKLIELDIGLYIYK